MTEDIKTSRKNLPARCPQLIRRAHSPTETPASDLKPGNIFFHRSRAGESVKVLDFGIAELLGSEGAVNGREFVRPAKTLGTPPFVAPERLRGEPYDGRVDVYSIGVMLMLMLCGCIPLPLKAEENEAASQEPLWTPRELRVMNPALPAEAAALILQALAQNPAERPSMPQFLDRWRHAMHVDSVAAAFSGPAMGEPDGTASYSKDSLNPDLSTVTLADAAKLPRINGQG